MSIAWFTLAAFAFIFSPVIDIGLGPYGDLLAALCLAAMILFGVRVRSATDRLPRELEAISLGLAMLVIYAILTAYTTSSEPGSLHAAQRGIRALLTVWGLYAMTVLCLRGLSPARIQHLVFSGLFFAITVHAGIMIVQFVVPESRDPVYRLTGADQVLEWNQQFRMAGLTNGGGAQLSLFQSVAVLALPFVLLQYRSLSASALIVACAIAVVFSLVLSGRSGVVNAVILLPITIFLAVLAQGRLRLGSSLLLLGASVTGVLLTISVLALAADYLEALVGAETATMFEVAFNRVMMPFRGEYGDTLTEFVEYEFFFPNSWTTLLFGDPSQLELSQGYSDRLLDSDSGYVRFLFGYGLLGSALNYLPYALIIFYSWKLRRTSPQLAYFSIFLALLILAYQVKEVVVFARMGLSINCLVFFALVVARDGAKSAHRFAAGGQQTAPFRTQTLPAH